MHLDRMLKWQNALIDLPSEKFNIDCWVRYYSDGNLCTVCAGGLATFIKEFNDLGLTYKDFTINYEDSVNSKAIAHFFDITVNEAKSICCSAYYYPRQTVKHEARHPITKEEAIAQIDNVIMANIPRSITIKTLKLVSEPQ